MSLFATELSLLTLRPSIRERQDRLAITTGLLMRLVTLFLTIRTMLIIPKQKAIYLSSRSAYFFSSRVALCFSDVSHIDYSFGSVGTEWGWTSSGFGRRDQLERFSLSIVTNEGDKHLVCSFIGEGAVCSGLSGVLLGDDLVDYSGTQEGESRQLATYLAELIGVTVGKPLRRIANMATCPACGRATSRVKPRCQYCGASVAGGRLQNPM